MSELNKAISADNSKKAKAGVDLEKFITGVLNELKQEEVIKDFTINENFSHKEFSYKKQYLASFKIKTHYDKYIIVRSSNSFRSDRAKIGFYDIDGINRNSNISKDIVSSIYLVPDEELNERDFSNAREKIARKEFYSPATHLFTISEFVKFLEEIKHDYENQFESEEEEKTNDKVLTVKESGSHYGKRGNQFEKTVVDIISDHSLLENYKLNSKSENELFDIIIDKIVATHNISKSNILKIVATNTVPLLKSGGNPKTDVVVTFRLSDDTDIIETISIKLTNRDRVSCHDYTANDFNRVLKCDNEKLGLYLNLFQNNPSLESFKQNLPQGYSQEEFEKLLGSKSKTLNEWVLRGMHDPENIIDETKQVSNFLLLKKMEKYAFYSTDEYINLISTKKNKTFGLPFGWTYPSKRKGKRIQLKLPVIIE